jgi:DNA-binding LacI/PurR family transcriptional regulator
MRLAGVIQPKITNPVYSEIISAIEATLYEAGYGLLLCDTTFELEREQDQLDFLLRQGGVLGIILIPLDASAAHIRKLTTQNIPTVILGTEPILGSDQVNVDAALGAHIITSHLLDLGHRRIGLLQGPECVSVCKARLKGYCQALADYHLSFDPALVADGEVDEAGGIRAMEKLLPLAVRQFSAVVAVSDVMALGALRVLRRAGLCVPGDISLASCDDIPAAAQVQPALTTVWQPKYELGVQASRFLLKQMEARKERGENWKVKYPFQSAMYHPHIIVRDSTRVLQQEILQPADMIPGSWP